MEPRKARITILNDVSLQCCPVPGSQVRSLLHDSVWEKLYHRKRKYPWNTSCWPSHTHTTCKAFTKLERNVDPYFSHLVGQPIPKRRTKTECTVDRINSYDLLKNSKQIFFKKRNRDCCFLVLHVSSLEVVTLSKQVKTWTNEKMNNASRGHRASRCSQDERNKPVQRVGTYLNWDACMETPWKPALGQRCLNCNWWMARGSVWTTLES